MTPRLLAPLLLTSLAACTTIPQAGNGGSRPPARPPVQTQVPPPTRPAPPPQTGFLAPQVQRLAGLERVIERDGATLVRQFGQPRLDVREGDMRKLQFSSSACVLDVFLYPLRQGAEPVATWVDARRASDGQEVDRAACVAALARG
ncbi:hypothetical protein PK98_12265 [Croceibacterium mercuriale]|uniref:Lipoprotein n=1 Tax=Croceibacterium mercuriale TaxID=1572751 RepID=A0A0B2BT65_9SPHN|nr:hypothetical protein [Croceibacterium mercuriale]KHL24708.1 hypothetical protein PK98_12265 [Croceibacterium mercuriale]